MSVIRGPVTCDIMIEGEPERVSAELIYDSGDPFAILIRFGSGAERAWLIARSIIAAGLEGPAGMGDVLMHPDETASGAPYTRLILASPFGTATVRMDETELRTFLQRTYILVPPRQEHMFYDMDFELSKISLA